MCFKRNINENRDVKFLDCDYLLVQRFVKLTKYQLKFIIFQVKAELDDSRNELKRVREAKKEEKKRLADEDAQRRIRQLEETCSTLQKQVCSVYSFTVYLLLSKVHFTDLFEGQHYLKENIYILINL